MKKIIPTLALSLFVLFAIGQVSKTGYYYQVDMFRDGNFSVFHGFYDINQKGDSNAFVKYNSVPELLAYGNSGGFSIPSEYILYSCCELDNISKAFDLMLNGTLDTNLSHKYDSLSSFINTLIKNTHKFTNIGIKKNNTTYNLRFIKIDALFCECVGYQNKQVSMIKEITKISKVKRKERLAFKRFILSHLE